MGHGSKVQSGVVFDELACGVRPTVSPSAGFQRRRMALASREGHGLARRELKGDLEQGRPVLQEAAILPGPDQHLSHSSRDRTEEYFP